MLSLEEVKKLVEIGRGSVLSVLKGEEFGVPEDVKERFFEKRGVFVTLLTFPKKELRGCVGIPYPLYPLWRGVVEASIGAAFRDPRFEPLRPEELSSVLWEISLLTEPVEIKKERISEEVKVGRDGLIVEKGKIRGLLLPQVPLKFGWDLEEFLRHTCMKAGLGPDCWREEGVKIYRFEAEVFEEVEPWGEVRRVR